MNKDFVFVVPVPQSEALTFVHRMRVELSRLRKKVIQLDRVPKSFKILFVEALEQGPNSCTITLKKSLSRGDVSKEIDEIFDLIAGGEKLDV